MTDITPISGKRPHSLLLLTGGTLLLVLSGQLVWTHANDARAAKQDALPLAASVIPLQKKLAVLSQEAELADQQSALRTGSNAERIRTFVLPADAKPDRVVAFIDLLSDDLSSHKELSGSPKLTVADETKETDIKGIVSRNIHVELAMTEAGIASFEKAIRVSGLLTVADAFTPDQLSQMLQVLEERSPADLAAFEQLAHADLLSYAQDPITHDRKFLEAVSSDDVERLYIHMKERSDLPTVISVLGSSVGVGVRDGKLWPLPFLTMGNADIQPGSTDGWYRVSADLLAYERGEK